MLSSGSLNSVASDPCSMLKPYLKHQSRSDWKWLFCYAKYLICFCVFSTPLLNPSSFWKPLNLFFFIYFLLIYLLCYKPHYFSCGLLQWQLTCLPYHSSAQACQSYTLHESDLYKYLYNNGIPCLKFFNSCWLSSGKYLNF